MGFAEELKPVLGMLAVSVSSAVLNIMMKKVLDEGMNRLVFITLRQLVALLFMAVIASIIERKSRPKLTLEILGYLFFSAMLGPTLTQYLYFVGLQYTSATFACAFFNITPVLTFLMAIPFRLETLDLRTKAGIAKVIGSVVCLGGAMLLTLYKGPDLTNTSLQSKALTKSLGSAENYSPQKWMIGSISLVASCLCWSSWYIVQSRAMKKYPAVYSSTAIMFLFSFVLPLCLSLTTQRGFSIWALKAKYRIITVLYAGTIGSGLGFLVLSWCVKKKGPVFTAAFTPLMQIVVAAIEFCFLHDALHLGSILGSMLVILGLYILLWGKSKDVPIPEQKPIEGNEESEVQLQF